MNNTIGVLFDIDGLGAPSSYGISCWRILMTHLDLRKIPGVLFYQGDLEIEAGQRPYCYCIAVQELIHTQDQGIQYFVQQLSKASDAGLFPENQRFIEGDIIASLIPSGRVDSDGRFRMSSNLGDLGDLRLVSSGREIGWDVLPDDDLIPLFTLTYLAKTSGSGLPLADESKELCESILREIGERPIITTLRAAGMLRDQLDETLDRLADQVWRVGSNDIEFLADKFWSIIREGTLRPLEEQEVKRALYVINELVDLGVDVDDPTLLGESTLLYSVSHIGSGELTQALLDLGADPNKLSEIGEGGRKRTPIMEASWRGHPHVVRMLLNAGADPGAEDSLGETALSQMPEAIEIRRRIGVPDERYQEVVQILESVIRCEASFDHTGQVESFEERKKWWQFWKCRGRAGG